jgi:hypothetical protein
MTNLAPRTAAPIIAVGMAALLMSAALSAPASPRSPREPREEFKYATMARCNTKDCHGAEAPKGSPALNEYTLWKANDPHSKAFTTLYKAPSKAIGAKMSIAKVHESPKCLSCHSKMVDPAQVVAGQKWSVQNGVSCEVCHGPGEKWVDPHATPKEKDWSHEKSVANGMIDLRTLPAWAASCASCHLQIDHEMVTAGHPRLLFELVDYNARTGAHWKTEKHPSMAPGFDQKAWTVGQAVSLAEALRNLGKMIAAKAPEERLKEARAQAAAHLALLKVVPGWTAPGEIASDPAKLSDDALQAERSAKTLGPADATILSKIAAGDPPKSFPSARQVALAFRALSAKPDAKAAIDKLCDQIAPKNEATFDLSKFTADYEGVRSQFK